jgi:hypothetical protein
MANPCEPLINVVSFNKPKMLKGLTKKGTVVGLGVQSSPNADKRTIGEEAGPNPYLVHTWNVVSHFCSCRQDRKQRW